MGTSEVEGRWPTGTFVKFGVPGVKGGKEGVGRVVGHRYTSKGPFVEVRDPRGVRRSIRPARLTWCPDA